MQDYTEKYFPQNNRIENIAGKYAFRDYYTYLYNNCLLMITIDSAPLHIANKLNVPNLSIWGPTRPANLIDTDTDNEYIYLNASCSPCVHQTDELPCGGDNFCITSITLLEITSKLQNLFEKTKASNFTN
jgi:ADP-heptose:LPS heptosyltransferase